jgi:hypothetical protein
MTIENTPCGEIIMAERIGTIKEMRAWLYKHGILRDRGSRSAHLHIVIKEIQAEAAKRAIPGPSAARSQDFLNDEYGLPK